MLTQKNLVSVTDKLTGIIDGVEVLSGEYVLIAGMLLLVLLEIIKPGKLSFLPLGFTLVSALVAGLSLYIDYLHGYRGSYFADHINFSTITYFSKMLLVASLFTTAIFDFGKEHKRPGEYYILLIGATLGAFVMVMAKSLLTLYIGIEIISLCSYLLTSFSLNKRSFEGGLKYLIFGAVATAFMLYGMSLAYGLTGSLDIETALVGALKSPLGLIYGLLILGGLLFKISAFPFHIWVPDVYEAAPTPITAYFSIAPKLAGLFTLVSIFGTSLFAGDIILVTAVAVVIACSITIGNLSAVWQTNLKRLMAYSSIAHAGFLLIGLLTPAGGSFLALGFYSVVYFFMNMAVFYMIGLLEQEGMTDLDSLNGVGLQQPLIGVLMLVTLVSLTGLPPTAGFTAKLMVFTSLWELYSLSENPVLLGVFILGLLNAVISLFYYIKIAFHMFMKKRSSDMAVTFSWYGKLIAALLTLPLLILFVKPDFLIEFLDTIFTLGG